MTEGGIASFKKKVGDKVDPGDVLCEIETDKATMEMESMESGYLAKILLPAGSQNVPVGQGVMVICEEEGDIGAFADYVSAGIAPAPPTGLEAKAPATASPAPPLPLLLPPPLLLRQLLLRPLLQRDCVSSHHLLPSDLHGNWVSPWKASRARARRRV